MERRGLLETVDETVWGTAVSPNGQCLESPTGQAVLDRIATFQDWASSVEAPVEMPFEESVVNSEITGDQFCRIVLPSRCIAVSVDDTIELVVPCRVDGEAVRIQDLLETIERWKPTPNSAIPTE